MKLSSFVMLSSWDGKLSSCVVVELSLVVVAVEQSLVVAAAEMSLVVVTAELAAVAVAVTQVVAVAVAVTKVDALVVAVKLMADVAMTSPNWKFQSLPRQTQYPTCAIGCDSQCSFQVSIHHSLQSIPTCFYGGQVSPCPQVL
jgi:hypothetical protein